MVPQPSVTSKAENIAAEVSRAAKKGPPPVHLWNPPHCGEIDIRIARDGQWYYLGTPIGRQPLVDLFSSILKREGDRYFLVTPAEKVGITVEDAPLFAWDVEVEGAGRDQKLTFTTRTGDVVTAGPGHAIRVERDSETDEPAPYIHVRRGLYAKIDRKTFYRLVDIGAQEPLDGEPWFGLWSLNVFYPIIPASELP